MSTRWYPLYQIGNPQLRVFLPNFWMKLVRPKPLDDPREDPPSNKVQFIVSMEMTRYDVKNYLKKIYNVEAISCRINIKQGKTKLIPTSKKHRTITKEDDYKVAFITLPEGQSFKFPNLFDKDREASNLSDDRKQVFAQREKYINDRKVKEATGQGSLPGWFR